METDQYSCTADILGSAIQIGVDERRLSFAEVGAGRRRRTLDRLGDVGDRTGSGHVVVPDATRGAKRLSLALREVGAGQPSAAVRPDPFDRDIDRVWNGGENVPQLVRRPISPNDSRPPDRYTTGGTERNSVSTNASKNVSSGPPSRSYALR